jgi:hypoxanthine-DNA glycosylase
MPPGSHELARQTGLPPIEGERCRALILGSFPGAASLAAREYYANPRNALWQALELVGVPRTLAYAERCRRLCELGIALWDGIESCVRDGSLDARIREPRYNDFAGFATRHPELRVVLLNGRKSAQSLECCRRDSNALLVIETHVLPSTSPANTQRGKLELWTAALRRALD